MNAVVTLVAVTALASAAAYMTHTIKEGAEAQLSLEAVERNAKSLRSFVEQSVATGSRVDAIRHRAEVRKREIDREKEKTECECSFVLDP